jgi:DNA-binding transcriptional LysR family regulator
MLASVPVDLRHFRSFVAVAEEGNIGRAAQRLYISQPALSRQVQQLEQEVGATLLVRGPRGVELTDAGRELLERARVALEAADDALSVGRRQEPHGRLLVGFPLAGGRERWAALAQAFAEHHPRVELELREAMSESLQRQVLTGELDVAVALAPSRLPSIAYEHLHDEPVLVWVRRDHPLAAREAVEIGELEGATVVLVGGPGADASGFNAAVRALFDAAGVRPVFHGTPELYPTRAARAPGYLGVSPVIDYAADVVGVPLVPACTMPFEAIHREDASRSAVRAFGSFARAFLAAAGEPCAAGMPAD